MARRRGPSSRTTTPWAAPSPCALPQVTEGSKGFSFVDLHFLCIRDIMFTAEVALMLGPFNAVSVVSPPRLGWLTVGLHRFAELALKWLVLHVCVARC